MLDGSGQWALRKGQKKGNNQKGTNLDKMIQSGGAHQGMTRFKVTLSAVIAGTMATPPLLRSWWVAT